MSKLNALITEVSNGLEHKNITILMMAVYLVDNKSLTTFGSQITNIDWLGIRNGPFGFFIIIGRDDASIRDENLSVRDLDIVDIIMNSISDLTRDEIIELTQNTFARQMKNSNV